jgi:hypothetical protein
MSKPGEQCYLQAGTPGRRTFVPAFHFLQYFIHIPKGTVA